MTKKEILRNLDRLKAEIDKPDPDLRDVMEKLEAIERRLGDIERTPRVVERVIERRYPYRYPYYQPMRVWCHDNPFYSSSTSNVALLSGVMNGAIS
jgi:hypothetical protein